MQTAFVDRLEIYGEQNSIKLSINPAMIELLLEGLREYLPIDWKYRILGPNNDIALVLQPGRKTYAYLDSRGSLIISLNRRDAEDLADSLLEEHVEYEYTIMTALPNIIFIFSSDAASPSAG